MSHNHKDAVLIAAIISDNYMKPIYARSGSYLASIEEISAAAYKFVELFAHVKDWDVYIDSGECPYKKAICWDDVVIYWAADYLKIEAGEEPANVISCFQCDSAHISASTLEVLRNIATFEDTDEELGEFMVSTGDLEEAISVISIHTAVKEELQKLRSYLGDFHSYLHVTFV